VSVALASATTPRLVQVLAPTLVVTLFVAWREWVSGHGPFGARAKQLAGLIWPFAAGATIPLGLYALVFWQQHGLADLIRGVFVLPLRRVAEASAQPPPIAALGLAVPYLALLLAGRRPAVASKEWVWAAFVAAVCGAVLGLAGQPRVYQGIWDVARAMPLSAAAAGVGILMGSARSAGSAGSASSRRVFLLITMAAMVALVQVPYATPTYFCYAAPMAMLAVLGVVYARPQPPARVHTVVAAFFFLFAAVFVDRSYGWNLGVKYLAYEPVSLLDVPRGQVLVPDDDKLTYESIVRLTQEHAAGGTIYAGPDCPEVYFLSGFRNPSRAFFEFLSPVRPDEQRMRDLLAHASVRAAVINTAPLFSAPLDGPTLALIEQRFPTAVRAGRFIVRW
jgi:hypothetical protein